VISTLCSWQRCARCCRATACAWAGCHSSSFASRWTSRQTEPAATAVCMCKVRTRPSFPPRSAAEAVCMRKLRPYTPRTRKRSAHCDHAYGGAPHGSACAAAGTQRVARAHSCLSAALCVFVLRQCSPCRPACCSCLVRLALQALADQSALQGSAGGKSQGGTAAERGAAEEADTRSAARWIAENVRLLLPVASWLLTWLPLTPHECPVLQLQCARAAACPA
jgi:hypothetical protein